MAGPLRFLPSASLAEAADSGPVSPGETARLQPTAESGDGPVLADLLPSPIVCLDDRGDAVFVNAAWTGLTGRLAENELGQGWLDAFPPEERALVVRLVRSGVDDGCAAARDVWARTVIGERLLRVAGRPHFDGGSMRFYVMCAEDVTEQVARERRLLHSAHHDPLTGLPNRACFVQRATGLLEEASLHGIDAGLLFIDLDDFKAVNDHGGHQLGDEVLRVVSDRLRAAVGVGDLVARHGGDEFAVLVLRPGGSDDLAAFAGNVLAALRRPMAVNGRAVRLEASIGAVAARQCGVDDLLAQADNALYDAKEQGKGRVVLAPVGGARGVLEQAATSGHPPPGLATARRSDPAGTEPPPCFHAVYFYDGDDDLLPPLAGYLSAGLYADSVLVIATPEHRRALHDRLDETYLASARADGRYLELDAAETLDRFMRDGSPDPDLFDMVVGGLVSRSAATHGRVRAYGEMVALLWAEGNLSAAMELERLWDSLQERTPFPLLCAYPVSDSASGSGAALDLIAEQHSQLLSGG
jgi:diguanylate cyclase (GGDEF)-like protein/PAS domain S-box-containing protein